MIRFRAIEQEDLELLRDWRNDPEVRLICREYRLLNMPMQDYWFEGLLNDTTHLMYFIEATDCANGTPFTMKDHEPRGIGVCGWTFIDWRSRHSMLSIYIGDKEYRTEEYYAAILHELHRIAFNELNLHCIRYEMYDFHPNREYFVKAGYKKTGVRTEQYYHDGKYRDIIVMSILKEDWKCNDRNTH